MQADMKGILVRAQGRGTVPNIRPTEETAWPPVQSGGTGGEKETFESRSNNLPLPLRSTVFRVIAGA